jgi:hypothetical protein
VGGSGAEGGREEAEKLFTGDEECRMAGNGAAAGLHGWRRMCRWGEGVGAQEGTKGQPQGLSGVLL